MTNTIRALRTQKVIKSKLETKCPHGSTMKKILMRGVTTDRSREDITVFIRKKEPGKNPLITVGITNIISRVYISPYHLCLVLSYHLYTSYSSTLTKLTRIYLSCLCSVIQKVRRTKCKSFYSVRKNYGVFSNYVDHIQKERIVRKRVWEKSKNLESLFTVLIPEIKSTVRSSSCKSVMYLKSKKSIRSWRKK